MDCLSPAGCFYGKIVPMLDPQPHFNPSLWCALALNPEAPPTTNYLMILHYFPIFQGLQASGDRLSRSQNHPTWQLIWSEIQEQKNTIFRKITGCIFEHFQSLLPKSSLWDNPLIFCNIMLWKRKKCPPFLSRVWKSFSAHLTWHQRIGVGLDRSRIVSTCGSHSRDKPRWIHSARPIPSIQGFALYFHHTRRYQPNQYLRLHSETLLAAFYLRMEMETSCWRI